MSYFKGLAEKIRKGERLPLGLGPLLQGASLFQRLGMWKRLRGTRVRVDARVISFGNITAGGVGKTPAVIERACQEIRTGHQVAVITRGYGAKPIRGVLVLPPGEVQEDGLTYFGDEALLIARRAPGVWIIRSADRVKGAEEALRCGCDTLLLDDAYQAVALERDENILLIDAANPFGNGHVLPRGLLREPLKALDRATEIILTRCDQVESEKLAILTKTIRRYNTEAPIRHTAHYPTEIRRLHDDAPLPLSFLEGMTIQALCGIGNPEAFLRSLDDLGAVRQHTTILADHEALDTDLFSTTLPVVMTEKDAVRVPEPLGKNLYALCIALLPWDQK